MGKLATSFCKLANRVPGLYIGHMPLVPTDEVRWFRRSTHVELRLWSVSVIVSLPASLHRQEPAEARWESAPIDGAQF